MAETVDKQQGKDTFPSTVHRFQPGETGNPNGRPKGVSLPAMVRKLVEDPELVDKIVALQDEKDKKKIQLPAWWGSMEERSFATAITMAMMMRALKDEKAANWVRKTGYGDKVDITSDGKPVRALVEFVGDGNPVGTDGQD